MFFGFDDTDTLDADRGTGKLVRWFSDELPRECSVWGVVRHQLLVDPRVPYTSHNSSACMVVDGATPSRLDYLIGLAIAHLERHALLGSDPGLCVAAEDSPSLPSLQAFGLRAARELVTQEEAREAAKGVHLSGHGGTNDGIIGAAAAVGLTSGGWSGRLIEYAIPLRSFAPELTVRELEAAGIGVVSVDRNGITPGSADLVDTGGWLRPRLWGGRAVLPVDPVEKGRWRVMGGKSKGHSSGVEA